MQRKIILIIYLIFLSKEALSTINQYSSPTLYGQRGLIRVLTAKSGITNKKGFNTALHLSYENQKRFIEVGGLDYDGLKISTILAFLYSPFPFFETSLSAHGFTNMGDSSDNSIQQIGNLDTSLKFAHDFGSFFSAGIFTDFYERSKIPDMSIYERLFGFDVRILTSLDLTNKFKKPFIIHFNGGYKSDNGGKISDNNSLNKYERYILDIVPYNRVVYGGGVEWLLSYISLVGEITGEYAQAASEKFYYHPFRLSAGIKVFPAMDGSLSLELLGDLGIVKSSDKEILPAPDVRIFLGASFRYDSGKPIEKSYITKEIPCTKKGVNESINNKSQQGEAEIKENVLEKKMGDKNKSESIYIKENKIILPKEILYDVNSQTPSQEQVDVLRLLAEFLVKNNLKKIIIEGYSDASGSEIKNKDISLNRAESAKKILVLFGVSGEIIRAIGLGSSNPKDTNETDEGRRKNRRVEFRIE